MELVKKCARILRTGFGWLLIAVSGLSAFSSGMCAVLTLFGLFEIDSFAERMAAVIAYIVMTAGFVAIFRLGIRLKDGGRKDKTAPPTEKAASPENQKEVRQAEENAPQGADDYLDDVTFISEMQHAVTPDGHWQQYDVALDARGYGWDMMKDWADYMAAADLEHISQVETGDMGGAKLDVTESYAQHGDCCRETPELSTERGMLSVAGMSSVLLAPVKIVWINQTNRLRLFTVVVDETALKKYVETMVRRSFGTENAMKLGKSAAACGKAAEKPASAKKLNLGTFSFGDADRQRLAVLPKKGLPERADTAQAHIALLDALDYVMDTSVTRLKTTDFWNYPEGMPEEEKLKRVQANAAAVMLSVDASLSVINPDYLRKKVEEADFDRLLNAWAVLNYYSGALKPQYTESIRNFRDYIHNELLTRYGNFAEKQTAPARLEGSGIYVDSAALLEWLKCNPAAGQYELYGAMPLTEKEPVITLYEDGRKTREYRLQTENDEDFTGKYFLIGIRMGMQGNPSVPVAQIDGFISDTPEERNMTMQDIGYRIEGHFLACGGENTEERREMNRGRDLPMKALKYVGYTTPANVRMVGICPDCGKSFCFHAYALYMGQCDAAYSDDGMECCSISDRQIDTDSWTYETDGKTFRYYNSFCCPHCGAPYIDYRRFPESKKFGVSGCVHLGRKLYYDYTPGQ